jgi:hypothetical protein
MKIGRWGCAFLAAGLMSATAYGQEYPFSDDFSNPTQTGSNWASAPVDSVSRVCAGGVYTVTNLQKANGAVVLHTFSSKVSTFTASCVVSRSSDAIAAGMWLSLSLSGTPSGYIVQLAKETGQECIEYVVITRYGATFYTIFAAEFHQQNPSSPSDTLMVSKEDSVFNVFCNGVYLGSCTDATYPSGDFGLFVPGNSTVSFDDAVFTDQFTQGSFPDVIIDSFNNSRIEKTWLTRGCSYFTENDSVLDISVPQAGFAMCDVRLAPFDTFASRLVVSWRGGDTVPFYGFYLYGQADTNGTVPMAFFGIDGVKYGKAYVKATSVTTNSHIRGKAIWDGHDSVFYKDTIDVFKKTGSSYYYMNVNGFSIDSLPTDSVTFSVLGAGIYCQGGAAAGQNIFVDYFFFGPEYTITAVKNFSINTRFPTRLKFSPLTSKYLFNPLGRIVGRRDAYGHLTGKALAPGFYITDEKKNGVIINKEAR